MFLTVAKLNWKYFWHIWYLGHTSSEYVWILLKVNFCCHIWRNVEVRSSRSLSISLSQRWRQREASSCNRSNMSVRYHSEIWQYWKESMWLDFIDCFKTALNLFLKTKVFFQSFSALPNVDWFREYVRHVFLEKYLERKL